MLRIAVAGAHLSGFPLNHQLVDLGARLVGPVKTAEVYKMYDLGIKPALIRQPKGKKGYSVELELWDMPTENFGAFLSKGVKAPLAIGDVLLADGSEVKGFVGESYEIESNSYPDISSYGGWKYYKQPAQA